MDWSTDGKLRFINEADAVNPKVERSSPLFEVGAIRRKVHTSLGRSVFALRLVNPILLNAPNRNGQ